MLRIRGLSKTFGSRLSGTAKVVALDGVDLEVESGQFAAVLGPSGCGKTTLLRLIAGFEIPDAGTIEIAGRPVQSASTSVSPHDRGVGIVPQDGALFPHLSVAQNVNFGLTGSHRQRAHRVTEVLDLVGLAGLQSRRPHELSGGQQQRVALARAIAPNPRLILLDEPFSALDAHLRQSLRAEVRELLKAIGATVVLVTHDQSEALTLADHLVVMRQGQVVQAGPPREMYYRPRDVELARFLGDAVVLDGYIDEAERPTHVSCVFGSLPIGSWHGGCGQCEVLIRPENIIVLPSDSPAPGVEGTVVGQEFYGHDQVIRVAIPGLTEDVAVRVTGGLAFAFGEEIRLSVPASVCTYSPDNAYLTNPV